MATTAVPARDYRIQAYGEDITGRPIRVLVTTDDRTLALDLTRFLASQRMLHVKLFEREARTLTERDGRVGEHHVDMGAKH